MCGTFSWFWICARRLYMHGGNRVMLTFPMSSALNVAFFASRIPRISRRSVRNAVTMSSFTGRGRPSSMCRWIASRSRACPRFRARAYAGSCRISSRLTFSARMNADASRRNGYFARVASSTSEGTPRSHKRPTRGPAKRELRIPMGPSLGLRCARRRRRDPQLHHQARDVPLSPVLDALTVLEPRDVDARDRNSLPGRRDAHELAAVGARHRPADDDLVAFRDDAINRRAAVGERGAQHEEPLLLAFAAGWH